MGRPCTAQVSLSLLQPFTNQRRASEKQACRAYEIKVKPYALRRPFAVGQPVRVCAHVPRCLYPTSVPCVLLVTPPPRSRSPVVRRDDSHGNHSPRHHPVKKRSPSPPPWRRHRSNSRTPPPHNHSDGRLRGAVVRPPPSPPPHRRRPDRQGLPETYYEKYVYVYWL